MPKNTEAKLINLEFIVLFLQAMFCNCYIAVFYCMEQWMVKLAISPNWCGFLLAILAIVIFLARPLVTWLLDGKNKTWPMILSVFASSIALLGYPLVQADFAIPAIFILRMLQGFFIAVYSSCTITLLVNCIPEGQSARGFALFSLTLLLPYAIIPAIGESLIKICGGEAELFAAMSILGIPALTMLWPLRQKMRASPKAPAKSSEKHNMWQSLPPHKLGLVYFACFSFSLMTNQAIFFVKGLCQLINAQPAYFFTTYTCTIMVVRLIANTLLDKLPKYPVIWSCALILSCCTIGMANCQGTTLIALSLCYGASMGLLYPLLAALVCDRSTVYDRSLNSNLMMAAFDCSAFTAPILGGLVIHLGFGYRGVFISASICVAICGLAILIDYFLQKRFAAQNS